MNKIYNIFSKKLLIRSAAALLLLSGISSSSFAQHVLLVNDNDNLLYNTDTIKSDLSHSIYSSYSYWSIPDSAGAIPTAAYMSTFDVVVWYCSTDGVGLKLWDATSTNSNTEVLSYASTGKPLWIIGSDVLYQKYATTPVTFTAGEFAKDVMGLASYDAQSYANDASTGCPQLDRVSTASTLFPASVHWSFPTAWYIDACTAVSGTREIYSMGPSSYALAGKKTMFHNKQPGISVMSTLFDPALIDTFPNRVTFMQQGITYLLGASASVNNAAAVNGVNLYPNPATSAFTLEINAASATDATIELFNTLGSKAGTQKATLTAGHNTINTPVSDLSTGVYMIRVTDVNGTALYTGKVNKQ